MAELARTRLVNSWRAPMTACLKPHPTEQLNTIWPENWQNICFNEEQQILRKI